MKFDALYYNGPSQLFCEMSAAYHAVGSAIGMEGASDADPLPQNDLDSKQADQAFDQVQYARNRNSALNQSMATSMARTGPEAQAAQNDVGAIGALQYGGAKIDPTSLYGGQAVGPTAQGTAAQLGPAAQSAQVNLGPTALADQVGINREDNQFRDQQLVLQQQLANQAAGGGPSLAAGQLRQATDRNIANQAALAASQGGRNAGTVQRSLALGAANMNAQAGRDSAQMRMQEQLSAQGQLAGLTSAGRSADIGVNTSQAGLAQQANLANQGALNTQNLAQGQMNMANNQFNTGAQNQFGLQQGQMNQQMNIQNLQNQLSNQQLQANLYQQAGMGNQAAINARAQAQAGLLQQAGLAGSAAQTQGYLTNTQNQQQTNLANQQSALQQAQLNDAMQRYFTEAGLGVDTRAQEAAMARQGLKTNQALGMAKLQAAGDENQANRTAGFLGGVASAAMMASDENIKAGVTSGNSKISQYLDSFSHVDTGPDTGLPAAKAFDISKEMNKAQDANNKKDGGQATSSLRGGTENVKDSGVDTSSSDLSLSGSSPTKMDPSAMNNDVSTGMASPDMAVAMPGAGSSLGGSAGGMDMSSAAGASGGADFSALSDERAKKIVSSNNVKMTTDNPGDRGFEAIGGNVRMDPDTGRGFKADTSAKGTLESWSDKQKEKKGGEGASGGEAREGEGPAKPAAAKPAPQATRKMSYDEMKAEADKMMANTEAQKEQLKSGPSVSGNQSWLDKYMNETSDEKAKKEISNADRKIAEFLDGIKAHTYKYKDEYKDSPLGGRGTYTSPMAQELQKSELGKSMVKKDENGMLAVDYGKGLGTMTAALAYLNEELKKEEG